MSDADSTPARRRTWLLIQVLTGGLIAVVLLLLLFWRVDFGELWRAVSVISPWHVVAASLCRAGAIVFRSVRWQRLGVAYQRATTLDCLSANATGMLIGLAFPGLNEFTRTYVLKRRTQVPFGSVLGVVMAERLIDMLLLLAVLVFALLLVPVIEWSALASAIAVITAVIAAGLIVAFILMRRRSAERIGQLLSRLSPALGRRVAAFAGHFGDGLRRLGGLPGRRIVEVGLLSGLLWGSNAAFAYIVFRAFGSQLGLGFGAALFTVALIYFGLIIRLTPAGFGQYHLVAYLALSAFGAARGLAISVAVVLHSIMLLVTILLGVPFLYREHLGIARLAREKETANEADGL